MKHYCWIIKAVVPLHFTQTLDDIRVLMFRHKTCAINNEIMWQLSTGSDCHKFNEFDQLCIQFEEPIMFWRFNWNSILYWIGCDLDGILRNNDGVKASFEDRNGTLTLIEWRIQKCGQNLWFSLNFP